MPDQDADVGVDSKKSLGKRFKKKKNLAEC